MLFSIVCMPFSSESPSLARFLPTAGGVALLVCAAGWALITVLRRASGTIFGPGRTSVDELVTAVAAVAALAVLLWITIGLLAAVIGALPGRFGRPARLLRDRIAPEAARRWAGLLLGVAVASTVVPGGAAAAPVAVVSADIGGGDTTADVTAPEPNWLPVANPTANPTVSTESDAAPAPQWTPAPVRPQPPVSLTAARETRAGSTAGHEVVVRRGDTLWDLAAAHLGPDASDAEIATEWQHWYLENRLVIGHDPDLILPGQVLTIPMPADAAHPGGNS